MALILNRNYQIDSFCKNKVEKATLIELINGFRDLVYDFDRSENILTGKQERYSDAVIVGFLQRGIADIKIGSVRKDYTMFNFPNHYRGLISKAGVVMCLIAEGILQLRNQVDYNDSGFSLAMFNKTGAYQGWAGFLLQQYMQEKAELKSGEVFSLPNAGFVEIISEFGYGHIE